MDETAAVQAIENVVETVIPEAVEVITVIKNNLPILIGATVVAAFGGALIGYGVAKKRLVAKYETISDDEIQAAKIFYATLNKADYKTPADAVQALIPSSEQTAKAAMTDYNGIYNKKKVGVVVEEAPPVSNIFVDNKPLSEVNFDYDAEADNRASGNPYVVTFDEYFQNEGDYNQVVLTYFQIDGVLLDENEDRIDDIDDVVGENNLERFGEGSKDNNIVYIRNDDKECMFEVIRSLGSYVQEVLGIVEPARSNPKIRKFRGDDD